MTTPFEIMLDKCMELHEQWQDHTTPGGYKLGYHNDTDFIMLYGIETNPESVERLIRELDSAGVSYRLVLGSVYDAVTNAGITDIGYT